MPVCSRRSSLVLSSASFIEVKSKLSFSSVSFSFIAANKICFFAGAKCEEEQSLMNCCASS